MHPFPRTTLQLYIVAREDIIYSLYELFWLTDVGSTITCVLSNGAVAVIRVYSTMRFGGRDSRSLLLILYRSCFSWYRGSNFWACVWVQRFCPKYGCEVPARAMDVLIKRLPFFIYFWCLSVVCCPSSQAQRCSVVQYNSLHVDFGYFF